MLGMLLDQQVPMEWAFTAPALLKERLGGGPLDATAIAEMDPAALEAVFRDKPALHRYPGSMAKRTQALCAHLVEHYEGRADGVWKGVTTGDELLARVVALPGFGQAEGADLRRAAGQAARRAPARLGGRGRRLAVDRRRRLLRTRARDPREEAGDEGGGRKQAQPPSPRSSPERASRSRSTARPASCGRGRLRAVR